MSYRTDSRLFACAPQKKGAHLYDSAACLAICALLFMSGGSRAGDLNAKVTDASGAPVANAVIALYDTQKPATGATTKPAAEAVMDQRDRQFAPHVLAVQRGASVRFPNSDDIRHQVYSFSPAKRFNLPLYHGVPAKPEVFDSAGEVVLGCNIHDTMFGYIYVVDSEWFAKTDATGSLQIKAVPAGNYRAQLWYPGLAATATSIEKTIVIPAAGAVKINFDNAVVENIPQSAPSTTRSWGDRRGKNP